MGIIKTLSDLKSKVERPSGGRSFLSLKAGESESIRFLQEISIEGKNYDEDRGTAQLIMVHSNPLDFRKKVACTIEDGSCWACEQVAVERKWRAAPHLLVNVATKSEDGTFKASIFDTTFSKVKVGDDLVEFAGEYGSVTDRTYKYKRTGSDKNDTKYSLMPLAEGPEPAGIADLELIDLSTVYITLPYDEQEAFLTTSENIGESKGNEPW